PNHQDYIPASSLKPNTALLKSCIQILIGDEDSSMFT
ncbi:MAG: hypothetical protein ACI8RD_009999, partial [Bacillariaceae sp.]